MAKRKFEVGQLVELKKSKLYWWTDELGKPRGGRLTLGRVIEAEHMGPRLWYKIHMLDDHLSHLFAQGFRVVSYHYSYELNPKEIEIKLEDLI